MPPLTHPARVRALRAEVDAEALRRLNRIFPGVGFTDADRIVPRRGRERAQEVETVARRHWRDLEVALSKAEAFVADVRNEQEGSTIDPGGFVTAQLAWIAPKLRDMITRAPFAVVTTGEAAFDERTPGRRTFIRDALEPFAVLQGFPDAFHLPLASLACFTLRAGFWPCESSEASWARSEYPTPAAIIAIEVERIRAAIRGSGEKRSAAPKRIKVTPKVAKRRR